MEQKEGQAINDPLKELSIAPSVYAMAAGARVLEASTRVSWLSFAQRRHPDGFEHDVVTGELALKIAHKAREIMKIERLENTDGVEFRTRIVVMRYDELLELIRVARNEGISQARRVGPKEILYD